MLKKIKTGIDGLDEMLHGGLIEGRPYVVCGEPGAGKTILCMQFLMKGVEEHERGLYVALEETAEQIKEDMSVFGWDTSKIKILETTRELGSDKWLIKVDNVISKPEFTLMNLMKVIKEKIDTYNPRRIVIDSITSIKMLSESEGELRRELLSLMEFLYKFGVTTLLTSESVNGEIHMEEFLASGVIKLHLLESKGEMINAISIEKIRGSDFDRHLRPMKITEKGIVVFPSESVFEEFG
ncbi:MAG: ATPase domain-containing protein [Candidatus Altiarchaeota archaeon]